MSQGKNRSRTSQFSSQARRENHPVTLTPQKIALALILTLGFFLRFHHLADIEFNIDQIYPLWQALTTIDTGKFPLAGQGTSVLFANPTLTGYIFLPFLLLSRVPLMAYLVTLTLNSFAIWLVYRALKRLIGVNPALIATALFAFNPWIIEDSRRTWVQSLLPFFICLIFWALTPVLTQQTRKPAKWLLITLIAAAIFANTYLLAYFIFAPIALLILLFWKRIPRQALLIGISVFAIFLSLYLVGLAREWDNTRSKADAFFSGESRLTDEALSHALRLVTGWEYAEARGLYAPADDANLRNSLSNIVHWAWAGILLLGLLRAMYILFARRQFSAHERDVALILLVWFILPILAMSYVKRQVHPFYLMFTVPAGHALAAWALSPLVKTAYSLSIPSQTRTFSPKRLPFLSEQTHYIVSRLVTVALIFTGTINGLNSIRFAQETAAHPGEHIPYTLPLQEAIGLGRKIHDAYQPEMTVYTQMDDWTPMVLAGKIFPVIHTLDTDHMIVVPRAGGLYTQFSAAGESLEPIMHGAIMQPPPVYFEDGTRVSVWQVRQNFQPRIHADVPSDIGVRFLGWHLLEPLRAGQTSHLRTYWQVDSLPADRYSWNFVPYVHVFDGSGERFLIVDGVRLPVESWQVGDWMVQQFIIEIPAERNGTYTVNAGIFDGVRQQNAIFNYPEGDEMIFTANLSILPAGQ